MFSEISQQTIYEARKQYTNKIGKILTNKKTDKLR